MECFSQQEAGEGSDGDCRSPARLELNAEDRKFWTGLSFPLEDPKKSCDNESGGKGEGERC